MGTFISLEELKRLDILKHGTVNEVFNSFEKKEN